MRLKLAALLLLAVAPLVIPGLPPSAVYAQASLATPDGLAAKTVPLPLGASQVELHWNRVPGAVGYEVLQKRGSKWWFNEEDPNRTPMTSSTTITGLEPATDYQFSVRAVGGGGVVSGQSAPIAVKTLGEARSSSAPPTSAAPLGDSDPLVPSPASQRPLIKATRPDAPSGLFGVFPEEDRVRLSWRPVPGAVRYIVEEEKDGKWAPALQVKGLPEDTSVILLDRPKPGPFFFRVRSMGPAGTISEPSWPIKVER